MSVVDFSFFKRFGAAIRNNLAFAGANGVSKSPHLGANGAALDDRKEPPRSEIRGEARSNADVLDEKPQPERPNFIAPWTRRSASLDQLRDGYDRVVRMMDAMSQHFERHDRRAEQMTESVIRMAGTLEKLAESQRLQGEFIQTIAKGVDAAGRTTGALSNTLGQLPATLTAQAEAMRAVARQMETSQQTESQLVHSVQRFGLAVDTLRESGAVQVETLQRLHAGDHEQREALKGFIREQSRRFIWVIAIAATLGLLTVATLAWTLIQVTSVAH